MEGMRSGAALIVDVTGFALGAGLRRQAYYALARWEGLTRFLDERRIEIDSDVVKRVVRPLALKNRHFAGSGGGPAVGRPGLADPDLQTYSVDPQAFGPSTAWNRSRRVAVFHLAA